MFPNTAIDPELINRLYRLAAHLERRWEGQSLPDDLGSRLIEAVLRALVRRKRDLFPCLERERAALYEEAGYLLRACWKRVAYRDLPRIRKAREQGQRASVSLDDPDLGPGRVPRVMLYDACEGDTPAGDTGRAFLSELQRLGYAPERAWAMLWHDSGLAWDDVQHLLAARLGCHATLPQLRQWRSRYAVAHREAVKAALSGDPEHEQQAKPRTETGCRKDASQEIRPNTSFHHFTRHKPDTRRHQVSERC